MNSEFVISILTAGCCAREWRLRSCSVRFRLTCLCRSSVRGGHLGWRGNLAAQRNFTGQTDTDFNASLCTEVIEAILTAVNSLRELEHRISYNVVSNIHAEEWYRSNKGDPAHDGDCLVLYMFRYPNKHPNL